MLYSQPRLRIAGDSGILIEFADKIDDNANERVHALARALRDLNDPRIRDLVPAYSSLLLYYDPFKSSLDEVIQVVQERLAVASSGGLASTRLIEIPTRYGGEHGPDLGFVARHNGIPADQVIELHSRTIYRVYMLGFLPGFAYMGVVPPQIAAPRMETPRTRVPAGSVGIAGRQTGVYPLDSPGGWQLIGRTELQLFDASHSPPALLGPGDRVRFVPI